MLVSAQSREDMLDILRSTGAMREGHFILPSGAHTTIYYQLASALRYLANWRTLTVGLSRVLRLSREVSSVLPKVSIVGPASGGIPVAFGVREALQAEQVVWVEASEGELRFRQFGGIHKGDRCVLVDDLLITGRTLRRLIDLIRSAGGEVVAIGLLVDARVQDIDFGGIPVYSLVKVETHHYKEKDCPACKRGEKPTNVEF